ncbi:hypothetical protein HKD37_01G001392 [Glycine soja]
MPRAMAPKKLLAKRVRKAATGEESSAAPQAEIEFDGHHFRSEEHQLRFKAIKDWSFLKERRAEVSRRQWTQLTEPMAKYDPKIVRGQWITYDEDAINQFLGHSLILEEGQHYEYAERRSQVPGFDEEAIGQLLCSLGQDFARSVPGRQLVYAILTLISVHVAQLILDAIYQFVGIAPLRHSVDPKKSNKALRFLALITSLCQFYRVPISPTKLIRSPINRSFIENTIAGVRPTADAPLPPPHQPPSLESISAHMQRMELQMHTYMQHLANQQVATYRDPNPYLWPTPEKFKVTVAWPGDMPNFQGGVGPAKSQGDEDGAEEDGDMENVMDFFL